MNIQLEVKKLMQSMGQDSPQKAEFFTKFLTGFQARVETECAATLAQEMKAKKKAQITE